MDSIQKNLAISAATLYALGVIVTAIHLSRFGVFDLTLAKVTYLLAGGVCTFYVVIRLSIAVLLVNFKVFMTTIKDAEKTIHNELKEKIVFRALNVFCSLPVIRWFFKGFTSEGVAGSLIRIILGLTSAL